MSFAPLTQVTSKTLVLSATNIDTDQIMPAKFLSMTTKAGLGEHVFANLRYAPDGSATDHILNSAEGKACEILVAGHNFGCGSSREHAPWGLTDYGIRVVISSEIALDNPGADVTVDLESCEVRLPRNGGTYKFDIDEFSRRCLMQGVDEMGYLQTQSDAIAAFEEKISH